MQIHQVLPTLAPGDAIGDECLHIRRLLRRAGFDSRIYADNIEPSLACDAEHYTRLKPAYEDLVIYHYSIGSDVTAYVRRLACDKLLWYHNITPARFFKGYNDTLARLCKKGRDELRELAYYFPRSIADSEYNRDELLAMGFKDVRTVPVMLDIKKHDEAAPDTVLIRELKGGPNVLFVGRFAPHKGQLELIRVFAHFKKHVCHDARLFLVGSYDGMEKYREEAQSLIKRLGVEDVHITGKVSAKELSAYYRSASVFLCASEHEGFCVPLAEAMYHRIPVIAYRRAAVPQTLGGSGIIYDGDDPAEVAEMMGMVIRDDRLRERVLRRQDARLKDLTRAVDPLPLIIGGVTHA